MFEISDQPSPEGDMLAETVRDFIEKHGLLPEHASVVVGVSGGVDSVVLAHVLRRLGYDVTAAHVNYGLRTGAPGDEAMVRRYCKSFSPEIPVRVSQRDAAAAAERDGASLQAVARRQRYAFFREVASASGTRHVAVGHHRDDQAETLLLNLLRGSGPEGLAGMRPKRPFRRGAASSTRVWLVRPLLSAGRAQVEAYAEQHGLPYRQDASNRDSRFRRAALRRDVLPVLEAHFPGASRRLARAARLTGAYVDQTLRPELRRRFEAAHFDAPDDETPSGQDAGGEAAQVLNVEALRAAPPVWQGRLVLEGLRRWCPDAPRSQAAAREMLKLLDAQPGRRVAVGGRSCCVWRERGILRFVSGAEEEEGRGEALPLAPDRPAEWSGGRIHLDVLARVPERLDAGGAREALFDANRVPLPLAVRPWRPGDRLRPLGMDGTKKVSDVLTDAKVSPSRRARVRVVCAEGAVVWIVGHRIAETARVRGDTRRVLRLTFEPAGSA